MDFVIKKYVNQRRVANSKKLDIDAAVKLLDQIESKYRDQGYDLLRVDAATLSGSKNQQEFTEWKIVQAEEIEFEERRINRADMKKIKPERYRIVRKRNDNQEYKTDPRTKACAEKWMGALWLGLNRCKIKLVQRRSGIRLYSHLWNTTLTQEFDLSKSDDGSIEVIFSDGTTIRFQAQLD